MPLYALRLERASSSSASSSSSSAASSATTDTRSASAGPSALPPSAKHAIVEEAESEPEKMLDAWEIASQDDGAVCRETLKSDGYKFQALPDRKDRDRSGCGIPHGVVLLKGPTGIVYDPPITIDCTLARSLGGVEKIVQEEAEQSLHSKIVRITNLGGFACRPRNFRKGASLSAHAVGSAVDLSIFHPKQGEPAIVDRDWDEKERSSTARESRRSFLRAVYTRLRRREADLTYIVGPDFNAIHHNHFHLDRGGWAFWFQREAPDAPRR